MYNAHVECQLYQVQPTGESGVFWSELCGPGLWATGELLQAPQGRAPHQGAAKPLFLIGESSRIDYTWATPSIAIAILNYHILSWYIMVLVPILLEDVEMFQKRHLLVAAHWGVRDHPTYPTAYISETSFCRGFPCQPPGLDAHLDDGSMGPTDIPLGFDPGFRRTYMFHETLEGFALKGGFPMVEP